MKTADVKISVPIHTYGKGNAIQDIIEKEIAILKDEVVTIKKN